MHLKGVNEDGLPEGLFRHRKPNLFSSMADLKNYGHLICNPMRYAGVVINGKPSASGEEKYSKPRFAA